MTVFFGAKRGVERGGEKVGFAVATAEGFAYEFVLCVAGGMG